MRKRWDSKFIRRRIGDSIQRKPGGIAGHSLDTESGTYTAEDLEGMTVSRIRSLAGNLGYALTKIKKADIINEFICQQEGGSS